MSCILEKESIMAEAPSCGSPIFPLLFTNTAISTCNYSYLTKSTLFLETDKYIAGITVIIPLTYTSSIIWMFTGFSAPLSKIWYLRALCTTYDM